MQLLKVLFLVLLVIIISIIIIVIILTSVLEVMSRKLDLTNRIYFACVYY
jgi:hypothetical protein